MTLINNIDDILNNSRPRFLKKVFEEFNQIERIFYELDTPDYECCLYLADDQKQDVLRRFINEAVEEYDFFTGEISKIKKDFKLQEGFRYEDLERYFLSIGGQIEVKSQYKDKEFRALRREMIQEINKQKEEIKVIYKTKEKAIKDVINLIDQEAIKRVSLLIRVLDRFKKKKFSNELPLFKDLEI